MPKAPVAYSKADLEHALREIKDGRIAIRQASRQYKIPRGTLQNRIHNRTKQSLNRSGPPPVLSIQEEEEIIIWLNEHARKGFPRRPDDLKYLVKEFLDKSQRESPFTDNLPGQTWYKCFLRRHPKLSLRTPEGVSDASSKVSESDIRDWFKNIAEYFEEKELSAVLRDPTRIYNADETSFQLCPKTGKVLAPKGSRNVNEINRGQEKEAITVLCTFSAEGDCLTPFIVLPYKRIPNDVREGIPDSFAIDKTDSGWMHKETFYNYVKNVFHPELKRKEVTFPVVLFVDGHKSHVSLELSKLCRESQIELICLYPNATRIQQPADVSCFKPIKNGWKDAVMIWRRTNVDKILTKSRFGRILEIVLKHCITKETIVNGFITTGLFPFDANAIDYSKCLGKNYNHPSSETIELDGNMNVAPIEPVRNISGMNGSVMAIDLKRFKEIVGEKVFSELSGFDAKEKPCSSSFALLHQIYQELSANLPTEINFENVDILDDFEKNEVSVFNLDVIPSYDDMYLHSIAENFSQPEVIQLPSTPESLSDEDLNNQELLNPASVATHHDVFEKKDQSNNAEDQVSLKELLVVPPTPKKKRTKKHRSTRLLVLTSDLFVMEEQIKIDSKNAELKAKEEKKAMQESNKMKKLQALEEKKRRRLEANLKKAAEKDQKSKEKAAEKERKIKEKAVEMEERTNQKAIEVRKRKMERSEREEGSKSKKKFLTGAKDKNIGRPKACANIEAPTA